MLAHAAALMASAPGGATACVQVDASDPGAVLGGPDVRATLDLEAPVALSLVAILHFVETTTWPGRWRTGFSTRWRRAAS